MREAGARGNKWVRRKMERKRKNRISQARAIPSTKVTSGEGRRWGGQETHDGLGYGVANARTWAKAMLAILGASRRVNERIQALLD